MPYMSRSFITMVFSGFFMGPQHLMGSQHLDLGVRESVGTLVPLRRNVAGAHVCLRFTGWKSVVWPFFPVLYFRRSRDLYWIEVQDPPAISRK